MRRGEGEDTADEKLDDDRLTLLTLLALPNGLNVLKPWTF
jgi:hypothetical protein